MSALFKWLDAPSQFPDYVRSTFQRPPGLFPAERHNDTKSLRQSKV